MGSATRSAMVELVSALAQEKSVTLATAEQLLSASRALASSAQLRSLLADPSIPADAKAGILSSVFPGAEKGTTHLLAKAVELRWSSPADLVDALEEAGIRAVAESEKAKKVEAELFGFAQAVASDAELELALSAKLGDPAGKASLVDALLAKKATPGATIIARHLVQSLRGRRIGAAFAEVASIVASAGDRTVATVTTASPLGAAQESRLTKALSAQYGRDIQLNTVIDPSLIGGLRVQVADDVIDGSVSARLTDLRIRLAG